MKKTLLLDVPPTAKLTSQVGRDIPFCLWHVVEKPLLHHWFDFAVDNAFLAVEITCTKEDRKLILANTEQATLWPLEFTVSEKPENVPGGFSVNTLPHSEYHPEPAINGNDLLVQHSDLVRQRLRYIWKTIVPEHPYYVVGHNCYIHPDAELEGPFWLGEGVIIEEGVVIGPNTCIGKHSRIAPGVTIKDTCVAPNVTVSPGLKFQSHLVEPHQIFNHARRILHPRIAPDVVDYRAAA